MANEAAATKEAAAAKSNDGPAPVIKWANPELIIRRCKIGKDWLKHHEPKKRKELFDYRETYCYYRYFDRSQRDNRGNVCAQLHLKDATDGNVKNST